LGTAKRRNREEDDRLPLGLGVLLFVVGGAAVVVGLLLILRGRSQGGSKFGAVVFIGPFPIAFGNDPGAVRTAAVLAVGAILVLLLLVISGVL
jgi:uncharacterized membrane protein